MEENILAKDQVHGDRIDQNTERGNLERICSLNIASTTSLKKIQRRRKQKAVGELINSSGNIKDIVEAMRNNPDSSCIQKKGCRALCELSYHNVPNQALIRDVGGIDVILSAMNEYTFVLPVQIWACKALINISQKNAMNQAEVCDKKGITVILQGMKEHFTNTDFQVMAFLALGNICAEEKKNRAAIREAEVVLFFIVAGMKYHSKCSGLQKAGCGLLANLSYQENMNKDLIVEAGGIEAIVIAMRAHPSDPTVFKFACAALTNICRTEQGVALLKSNQGVGALLHCLRMFPRQCSKLAAPLLELLGPEETH
eukprot:CAMPEP_0172429120 /NCGR_PEP_ID=MMETSP1064-20121228/49158_1 /TAXON_ID=202472 /ORGANISM="Aulacoseira subarctica , Strain CCAP 1002/5" /LENGTH=312 /DNA_ID=CAMNT_0013174309 /DNA_START=221 /DNA_END=1159 /DNA_ORIENTATION=-